MIKNYKIFENAKDRVPIVGLPSGEYLEISFKLFDLLHSSGVLFYNEKYGSFTFDDKDYDNIIYYMGKHLGVDEKQIIKNFLNNIGVTKYRINSDNTVDSWDDVIIEGSYYEKLPVAFDCVMGDFKVLSCGLKTLKGCPDVVGGDFICNKNKLYDLKGGPTEISGDYDVRNNGLYSLEGSPKRIKGDFDCSYNNMPDLNGSPKIVECSFISSNGLLVSLKGAPEIVKKNFDVSFNLLDTLYGTTTTINGVYDCSNNDLKTLKDGPKSVGIFKCNGNNKLRNLDGAPVYKKIISDEL